MTLRGLRGEKHSSFELEELADKGGVRMKLYSGPLSLFTAKVRIALEEKNIPCERIEVPFSRAAGYTPKHPDVLAINPKAQVPVLVDGDLEIYDSTIILEYLEDLHPEPRLYPRDVKERARCRLLEAAADEVLFPHVLELIREVFYKPDPATRDAAKVEAAQNAIREQYRDLDRKLAGREYFSSGFTVADVGYFLVLMFAANLGIGVDPSLANLSAWLDRVAKRPSVAREVAYMLDASQRV
jgi:glutathione S-transferase